MPLDRASRFTHADLLTFPEDHTRREIIDGDLFIAPTPFVDHQRFVGELAYALGKYSEEHRLGELVLGPMDVILNDLNVLNPDLLFVLNEHKDIIQDWVRGAPDLVIEILSPTTAARDRGVKLRAYARFGVKEYWIVDPEAQAIEIYRLTPEGYDLIQTCGLAQILTSPLLPGFQVAVRQIFQI